MQTNYLNIALPSAMYYQDDRWKNLFIERFIGGLVIVTIAGIVYFLMWLF